jgi:hypothetical protein
MKKLLIASAALAMVAGSVQAQSSVTIYGTLDAGYDKLSSEVTDVSAKTTTKTTGKGVERQAQGALTSSRIGFRGTEDIGGGLKANFNLEYEINPGSGRTITGTGDGGSTTAMRTSTVGLSGGFGTFNIGRQLTGIHGVVVGFSPLSGNNMVGDLSYSAATRLHSEAVRADNSISYITPTMSGFNARVDYAADSADVVSSTPNSGTKTDHLGLSANYTAGATYPDGHNGSNYPFHSVTTDGSTYYAACPYCIHKGSIGTLTSDDVFFKHNNSATGNPNVLVKYAKGNVFVGMGRTFGLLDTSDAPTSQTHGSGGSVDTFSNFVNHINTNWNWVDATGSPGPLFFAGNGGNNGEIWSATIDPNESPVTNTINLAGATMVLSLPDGETINAIFKFEGNLISLELIWVNCWGQHFA